MTNTQQLRASIARLIDENDPDGYLTPRRKAWMTNHLSQFVIDSAIKFIDGQREHSDNEIENCDLIAEARNEVLDLQWYLAAKRNPLK